MTIPLAEQLGQKRFVFLRRLTAKKILNAAGRVAAWALKLEHVRGAPIHLKIDVAPKCQLACPVCLHGSVNVAKAEQRPPNLDLGHFKSLVDQVAGKTMAMSLYNLGEPLLNRDLEAMAEYAERHGINTYLTTNFSLPLRKERIEKIVASGISMVIIAVDGVSKETYGRQRINGNWDLVHKNIENLVSARHLSGKNTPRIAIQFIEFDFNLPERQMAINLFRQIGVDELAFITGQTVPWTIANGARQKPRAASLLPRCAWPYFSAVVNSDGTVVQCCNYRMEEVLLDRENVPTMGDLRRQTLGDIMNGPQARAARAISSNPVAATDRARGHFCEGCQHVAVD